MRCTSKSQLEKSFPAMEYTANPSKFFMTRYPGQIPNRERLEMQRLEEMPAPMTMARLLQDTRPRLTPESVVDGLGLSKADESRWKDYLRGLQNEPNELRMRQGMYGELASRQYAPELRRAIAERAVNYYRTQWSKSLIAVRTPDELLKSGKSGNIEAPESITATAHERIQKGGGRVALEDLADLVARYGSKMVGRRLNDEVVAGRMRYAAGQLEAF